MKKFKRPRVENEKEKRFIKMWKRRIMEEKGCTEAEAEEKAKRIEALTDYMHYGHAAIAFYKQDGTFQLVTGTLIPYSKEYHHPFDMEKVHSVFVYWNEDAGGWRTFQIENFLGWKAIV